MRRLLELARIALATLVLGGCSEKAPGTTLVWRFSEHLTTRRAALTSVVGPPGQPVVATGFIRPEGTLTTFPIAFTRDASGWTGFLMPLPASGASARLLGSALTDDGDVWACGSTNDILTDPITLLPLVYRRTAGSWAEVPITGIGDLHGIELRGVASYGSGASEVTRFVGIADNGTTGIALTLAGGAWSRDTLPAPTADLSQPWSLNAIVRRADGGWLALGGRTDAPGGSVYVDDGAHAWRRVDGPSSYPALEFTTVALDPDGRAWSGGNVPAGDSLQGVLFRGDAAGGHFSPVSVTRHSPGTFRIYGIAFDAIGHSWAVGGRSGGLPFIAGTIGESWTESIAEIEREALTTDTPLPSGSVLYGCCVLDGQTAYAVGYSEMRDIHNEFESETRIFELGPRPVGEIDATSPPPTAPHVPR